MRRSLVFHYSELDARMLTTTWCRRAEATGCTVRINPSTAARANCRRADLIHLGHVLKGRMDSRPRPQTTRPVRG